MIPGIGLTQVRAVQFQGQVLSSADSLPIPFVNIYTEGNKSFTSSSASGFFSIDVLQGDTLNFSAVGFKPKRLIAYSVEGLDQDVYLSQVTYELPGLTIYGRDVMEGFYDHDRLYYPKIESSFERKFPKPSLGVTNSGGAGFTGLLSLLASQFNSEYKQLKKLEKIKKEEYPYFRRLELIYTRLPNEYIVENTSLNKGEIEEFLEFWMPSLHFLETADGYQLLAAIQEQEKAYIKQSKIDNRGKNVVSTIELRKLLDNYGNNQ